jgi:hypothetical protein
MGVPIREKVFLRLSGLLKNLLACLLTLSTCYWQTRFIVWQLRRPLTVSNIAMKWMGARNMYVCHNDLFLFLPCPVPGGKEYSHRAIEQMKNVENNIKA